LAEVDKLDKFSSSLNNFALSMNQLGDMDVGDIEGNIGEIAENISKALPVIKVMVKGGTIGEGFFDGYPEMDFGPEGEGGLLNPDLKLNELTIKARQLRGVFDANIEPQQPTQQSPLRPPMQMPSIAQPPVPVVIVPTVQTNQVAPESMAINALSPQAVAPVNITNVSNVGNSVDNSSTAVSAGGGSGPVHAARTYNGDPVLQSVMHPAYAG